jgi:hypothetical protein
MDEDIIAIITQEAVALGCIEPFTVPTPLTILLTPAMIISCPLLLS